MMKERILFLSHYGANPQFQEFFSGVADTGNQVKVILPKEIIYTNGYRPQRFPKRTTINNVEYIPAKLIDPKKYQYSGYWPELFLTILKYKPTTIIVTDEVYTMDTFFVVLFKLLLLRRYKIVTWSQAHYLEDGNAIKQRAGRMLLWWNKQFVHRFVARNQLQAGRIKKVMRKKDKVQHVYWSTNPERFKKSPEARTALLERFGLPIELDSKQLMGFVGRLVPEKGLVETIKLLPQLPQDLHFIIVGSGHEDYIKAIKETTVTLHLENRVHLVGDKGYELLVDFYNILDLFILPTVNHNNFYELFGRVLPEAMMCKTLVVGSNNGAIPEVIGRTELIFKQGDAKDMLSTIQRVLNFPPNIKEALRDRQYAYAIENFSVTAFARNLLTLVK